MNENTKKSPTVPNGKEIISNMQHCDRSIILWACYNN